jgi:hypothetical protein
VQTKLKIKNDEADEDDPLIVAAEQRRRVGLAIAKRIGNTAARHNSKTALGRAYLIARCSDADNIWACDHLPAKTGERFAAFGVKSACGSLLCPNCIKLQQRRSQKRLVAARDEFWKERDREIGKYERFITLTAPTLPDVDERTSEKIFNLAYQLLSDRPFYAKRMDAGVKHIEFTFTPSGFNTHIHLLIYGAFIEVDKAQEAKSREWRKAREAKAAARGLRIAVDNLPPLGNLQDVWTDCISEAARAFGFVFDWRANYDESLRAFVLGSYSLLETRKRIVPDVVAGCYSQFPTRGGESLTHQPTPAARAVVDVRMVREKGQPSVGEIGLTKAIKEVTKYITKAAKWSDVPDAQLVKIAEVRRWPRRFELLGAWRKTETPEEKQRKKDAEEIERANSERKIVRIMPGESWDDFMQRAEREGAHPDSFVIAWDKLDAANYAHELDRDNEAARIFFYASLDTDFLFRSDAGEDRPPPEESPPRERQKPLMTLLNEMDFEQWMIIVNLRLVGARRARAGLLARQFKYEGFVCLDGSKFLGVNLRGKNAVSRMERMEAICQKLHERN